MDENQKLRELERKVADLEKWKKQREQQQITYPLDFQSQQVLNKYFLTKIEDITYSAGMAGGFFRFVLVEQDGQIEALQAVATLTRYTANPTTDFVTAASGVWVDGQQIIVISTDIAPSPLTSGNAYFVVNATSDGKSFQLEATFGGGALDITDTGTGQQYFYFYT